MAINPGYGFIRTQKMEVPLENDRPLFEAARVARVEEAARVATEASIRIKREAKEMSAQKRQEVKQMPLRQLPQCEALDNQQGLNKLLSDTAHQNKHNKRHTNPKAASQTISVSDEDNAR